MLNAYANYDRIWLSNKGGYSMESIRPSKSELELIRTLVEAEDDVANGRIASMQSTFDEIRKSLAERGANEI